MKNIYKFGFCILIILVLAFIVTATSTTWNGKIFTIDGGAEIGNNASANYFDIDDEGTVTLNGDSRVNKVSWVDAGGIKAPGSNPATFVESGMAGAWEFGNAIESNQEHISGIWKIPTDMEKAEGATMKLNWYANGASPGNAVWQLEYLWVKVNQDETGVAQGTVNVTSTASSTSNGMVNAEFTGIEVPDSDDSGLFFKITRLSGSGVDNIGADIYLRGRAIFYTANKLGSEK